MKYLMLPTAVLMVLSCSSNGDKDVASNLDIHMGDVGDGRTPTDALADNALKDVLPDNQPACEQGDRRCKGEREIEECQQGVWVFTAACTDTMRCQNGTCVVLEACDPGTVEGCYSLSQLKQCNEEGTAWVPVDCPETQVCLQGVCGIADCLPGQTKCIDGETLQECGPDGTWNDPIECSGGKTCVGGKCLNECLSDPKWNNSYIGCEYWSLDLDNYPDPYSPTQPDEAPHGVILANPGTQVANIVFKSFASDVPFNLLTTTVEPGDIRVVEMPRMDIDGSIITDRSVRIVSNRPVVAYQFNPLDFKAAYSDDSSLLLPAEMLGTEYFILNYPTSPLEAMPIGGFKSQHGYFTVLAIEEGDTNVSVRVTAKTESPDVPDEFLLPGSYYSYVLKQGQVLNLQSTGKEMSSNLDLSGSHVTADKRIAVFSGHEEAVVQGLTTDPYTGEAADCCCAEHLEEQLFPLTTWADSYLCVKAKPRGDYDLDLWRVQAGVANITLTTDPPIEGINGVTLAQKGDWVEAFSDQSFVVTANGPIQVAQYLSSGTCTGQGIGDPALIMAVAQSRYRTPYAFAVPKDYTEDWITVVRPAGENVMLDNVELPDQPFQPIATTGFEAGYFKVEDGPHYLESAKPIGLYQYGFNGPASYGHSGGLNLVKTVQ